MDCLDLDDVGVTRLRQAVPLLRSEDDLRTIHLYANHSKLMVMPEKFENAGVVIECEISNSSESKPLAVSLDKRLFERMLDLDMRVLQWSAGDSHAPLTAKSLDGLFVFMPLKGGDVQRITKEAEVFLKRRESGSRGVESQVKVNQTSPAVTIATGSNMEDKKMVDEKKVVKEAFQITGAPKGEVQSDPLEDLLATVVTTRLKAREFTDGLIELQKQVKEAQRLQRHKEREFKSARELLGKLKKVSGF